MLRGRSQFVMFKDFPPLLNFVDLNSHPHYALEALLSLQSFFTLLLLDLPSFSKLTSSAQQDAAVDVDVEFIYETWLRAKFNNFLSSLIILAISSQSEQALREVTLDTVMEFVKIGNRGRFQSAIYHNSHDVLNIHQIYEV